MPLLHACRRFPHPSTGRREDDDELSSIARDDDELMTGAGRARARARICDADDEAARNLAMCVHVEARRKAFCFFFFRGKTNN
jgi:hypothetical protein